MQFAISDWLGGSAVHQGFDLVGFDGGGGHEVHRAVLGNDDVVFEADGEVFFRNVDAGFDGEDPAGGEGFGDEADVVDIEAEGMAETVHEVFSAGGGFLGLFFDVGFFEETEGEEFVVHHHLRFFLPIAMEFADGGAGDAGAEDAEDGLINLSLAACEAAIDRDGAGEVGVVVGVAGGDIEEEEVAVFAGLIVLVVVQGAGVDTGGDDGVVGEAGAAAGEFVGEFGLDFDFVDAGLDLFEEVAEALFGDGDGLFEEFDFRLGFNDAQLVQEAGEAVVLMERILRLGLADETEVAGLDRVGGALVFVGVKVNVFGLAEELAEEDGKLGEPLDGFDAGDFLGFLLGVFVAFPDFQVLVGFAEEKDFAKFFVVGVRGQDKDAFLLFDAGEVEEVGIGYGEEGAVGVGGGDVVRIYRGDGVGEEESGEAVAVGGEEF